MTAAAIRLSRHVESAVSRPHQLVTRHGSGRRSGPSAAKKRFQIDYVTNGVHLATWMAQPIMTLLDAHLGNDWGRRGTTDPGLWTAGPAARRFPGLWQTHQRLKHTLLSLLREEVRRAFAQRSRDANQTLFGFPAWCCPTTP